MEGAKGGKSRGAMRLPLSDPLLVSHIASLAVVVGPFARKHVITACPMPSSCSSVSSPTSLTTTAAFSNASTNILDWVIVCKG